MAWSILDLNSIKLWYGQRRCSLQPHYKLSLGSIEIDRVTKTCNCVIKGLLSKGLFAPAFVYKPYSQKSTLKSIGQSKPNVM